LAALAGPLGAETLRDHLQIVLTEGTKAPADQEIGVAAANTWRVTDLAAKHALLLAGIGWGRLPDALVADDLAAGRLVHLPTEDWNDNGALRHITLVAAYRRDEPLGPAGRWLLARLGGDADTQPPVS
jgi:DNA-binding transcriptional LysR family regulator